MALLKQIETELLAMQELQYRAFMCKLIPTVLPEAVIGIRTPKLRALAKRLENTECFTSDLPHRYYEENQLHAFLIEPIKDFEQAIVEVERFLPYVDNWATCDGLRPKCFRKNAEKLMPYIEKWLSSEHCYTIRFGIEMLMLHYLDGRFDLRYADMVAAVRSEEYYVNMMIAWYFAEALAKQYDAVLPYLKKGRLSPWVHNKAIQKAIESRRVTQEHKDVLRRLRRR